MSFSFSAKPVINKRLCISNNNNTCWAKIKGILIPLSATFGLEAISLRRVVFTESAGAVPNSCPSNSLCLLCNSATTNTINGREVLGRCKTGVNGEDCWRYVNDIENVEVNRELSDGLL